LGYVIGLPLELLIVAALLRGEYRRFPLLFLYVLADFLTSAIEIRPSLNYGSRTPAAVREWAIIYWVDERIMQTLVFLLVISLIYQAAATLGPRRTVVAAVICATLLVVGVTFLVHHDSAMKPGKWMTPWTRDLNFVAAILDLGLWVMLMRPGRKDYRLVAISGALGILFTGQAIGQSLREIGQSLATRSPSLVLTGNIVHMLANLACLFIWWQTFRRRAEAPAITATPAL
jgi:hypothetical protein